MKEVIINVPSWFMYFFAIAVIIGSLLLIINAFLSWYKIFLVRKIKKRNESFSYLIEEHKRLRKEAHEVTERFRKVKLEADNDKIRRSRREQMFW